MKVAGLTEATNVIGHEYLHAVISSNFSDGIGRANLKASISSFVNYLNDIGDGDLVAQIEARLATQYDGLDSEGDIIRDKDGLVKTKNLANQEEYFNIFSDLIKEQKIDNVVAKSSGLTNSFRALARGLGVGNAVDFQDGAAVFEFLVDYKTNINRSSILGKITSRGVGRTKFKGLEPKQDKRFKSGTDIFTQDQKQSLSDVSQDVNDIANMGWTNESWKEGGGDYAIKVMQDEKMLDALIYAKYKADEVPANFVKLVYSELTPHIKKFKPEDNDNFFAYVNSQIANKAGNVYNREFKQKPEDKGPTLDAKTKEGKPVVQPIAEETTSDFETENILATQIREQKGEVVPTTVVKETTKSPRVLSNFDIDLQDGLIDSEILAEIESLLSENPNNLKQKLDNVVKKHLIKKLKDQAGKIQKIKGEVVISPEYESFIRNEFDEIKTNLDIQTIRKLPWFDRQKIGTEDVKGISKVTGKTTNFRKGIFINKANKPKYLKYYTQGGFTTLRERQSALLSRIIDRKVDIAVDNYIQRNSTNIDAVVLAKLNTLTRTAELAQNELKTFDTVKYSLSAKVAKGLKIEFNKIKDATTRKGTVYVGYVNPFTQEPQRFTDLGKIWEQTFANYFYNMNIDGLEILSQVATEEGSMADFIFKYFGQQEKHEIKAGLMGVFMGSTLFNSYNYKTGEIVLANNVHNNLLTKEIIDAIKKGHKKRVDQWNVEIKKLNKETKEKNLKRPIYPEITYDIVPGKPQFVPYETYHDKSLGKKSIVAVESNEKPSIFML